ncbi:tryptophan synthase subunit alpha [Oribacterium sp. WCC10]|uniref:tryptophan synthase subunit alpha n=1 Tax=Oribacterium sp. WCC10 TaxID=1855343 RepID=UPI0008ED2281|nr:tryptophan synthase subunit alpha [Oribacterium sp. WCC10]SFG38052.1 tryptophan synthase, alpha chain [Oribacterium sp. WCC10]
MSRITEAFKDHKAFIPFITCGDPDLETTRACVLEMVKNGADIIELGIPFSDPTAEGPVIMEADNRALKSGVTTDKIFEFTKELRKEVDVPFLYMTYANVVFSYGTEKFMKAASEAGVSGLILPDVPYEEKGDFEEICDRYGVELISMITPASNDRIRMIAKEAKGYIYVVSSLGVTGERSDITADIGSMVKLVKENTDVPCAVGFGISSPEQAGSMAALSDGAIVGSSIVKIVAEEGANAPQKVGALVKAMSDAVHKAS